MTRPRYLGGDHSLATRAHEQIEDMIIEGSLLPGERLVETQLAKALGVSRGPIRQALIRLAHEGWVEHRPRHGAYVRPRDPKGAEDFFRVRQNLEVMAAGLAAENWVDDDVERLGTCLEDAEILSKKMLHGLEPENEDARKFHRESSIRFHRELVETTKNSTLVETLDRLVKKTRWYFSPGVLYRSEQAWAEHREIVAAIVDRDVERARQLMDEHMDNTLRAYLKNLR